MISPVLGNHSHKCFYGSLHVKLVDDVLKAAPYWLRLEVSSLRNFYIRIIVGSPRARDRRARAQGRAAAWQALTEGVSTNRGRGGGPRCRSLLTAPGAA
jgi:hypothetical protein